MAKLTKTDSKTFKQLADNLSKGQLTPSSRNDSVSTRSMPGQIASGSQSRTAVHTPLNDRAANYLQGLHASSITDDSELPIPVTPENLPAIISTAVGRYGQDVKWHMVKNLPVYMSSAIRSIGRQVFAPFTKTPIEKIQVLSSLTNSDHELSVIGDWIAKNGRKNDRMTMQFEKVFPGYDAQIDVWQAEGYTFVVVKDFMGKYIYAWPE